LNVFVTVNKFVSVMKAVNVWWFEKWSFHAFSFLCHMDLSMLNFAVVVVVALYYVLGL